MSSPTRVAFLPSASTAHGTASPESSVAGSLSRGALPAASFVTTAAAIMAAASAAALARISAWSASKQVSCPWCTSMGISSVVRLVSSSSVAVKTTFLSCGVYSIVKGARGWPGLTTCPPVKSFTSKQHTSSSSAVDNALAISEGFSSPGAI